NDAAGEHQPSRAATETTPPKIRPPGTTGNTPHETHTGPRDPHCHHPQSAPTTQPTPEQHPDPYCHANATQNPRRNGQAQTPDHPGQTTRQENPSPYAQAPPYRAYKARSRRSRTFNLRTTSSSSSP